MSTPTTEALPSTVVGELTTTLMPTVTRVDTRLDINPVSIVLAVSIVFILSPITVTGNSIILAAFYRYKRLRTASNCLLVSLAVSDFGVGVFMPFGIQLELSGLPENGVSTLCIAPYCIVIALCSVSVLVTVAIAVDRLTSLAQPLRYKNIITHSSIEKYIAVFWIYAIGVGLSPLIYAQIMGVTQPHSGSCRFGAAVQPPVRVFLVVAVWAPSALVLLGCYMYVYLVARAHARAIYTVELSFRHQTQTLALPRYGQTLAVTVGAFLILWLPFQTCMLLDIFCGTNILSEWTVIWLGLPILAHSGANPWIYAFHHGEMRVAAGKVAEDLVALFGVTPSRYGCSPTRRGSHTNLELAEVNNSNGERRHPVEDCFAMKQHSVVYSSRCLEMQNRTSDISPEGNHFDASPSSHSRPEVIIEEDIHDLKKMLDPKYIIDRNHVIDSNHNIDKIKNLKYLLDPTFNKIRHLRRLNHKRLTSKNFTKFNEPKFISYQNLKSDGMLKRKHLQLNTMSDPVLNVDSPAIETKEFNDALCTHNPQLCKRRNSNLSSLSDPDIKGAVCSSSDVNLRLFPTNENTQNHRYSIQNLDHNNQCEHSGSLTRYAIHCRHKENQRRFYPRPRARAATSISPNLGLEKCWLPNSSYASLPTPECTRPKGNPMQRVSHITITPNKLANFFPESSDSSKSVATKMDAATRLLQARKNLEILQNSQDYTYTRLLEPARLMNNLIVPRIHSEPPSPIDPLPLESLKEEDLKISEKRRSSVELSMEPQLVNNALKSPIRHSDPVIPSVLLNIEDCTDTSSYASNERVRSWFNGTTIEPEELSNALWRNSEKCMEYRIPDPIFPEHDSTRYSSRRPSDSKWSESSRSQEVLSNITEHQTFQSSYSVNNFQTCNSGSDLNDLTSLDPFMCPDALSSSLRESFFGATSMPDSDNFTSFDETDERDFSPEPEIPVHPSVSSINIKRSKLVDIDLQSKSSESVFRNGQRNCTKSWTILRLEPSVHRSRPSVRPGKDYILRDALPKRNPKAPLAVPTPTDICTSTFDMVSEMADNGVGVVV